MNLEQSRYNMIEQQIRPWNVLNQTILDLLARIPRDAFVPEAYRKLAYVDTEIPLGHGEFMMPPRVEARMLQDLAINHDDSCLEIGTGSAYVTACLASLSQHVDSVDLYSDFTKSAEQKLQQHKRNNVELMTKDVSQGWKLAKPQYDVIAITASMPTYHPSFENLLKPKGRLFVIIGKAPAMAATLITRSQKGDITRTTLFETVINPLVGKKEQQPFVF